MLARFECPTSVLAPAALLSRGRRALSSSLLLAVAVHLSLSLVSQKDGVQAVSRPLTTQFVKRQPRLTKPLELKKRPRPKRRQLQREMVSVKAKVNRREVTSTVRPVEALGSLARPGAEMTRSAGFSAGVWEPQAAAQMVEGSRESQYVVDMSLEMVDIEDMDTGQYQAMVIQDQNDERNIKGYLHLAIACPYSVSRRNYQQVQDIVMNGLRRLIARLNEWTEIRASVAETITFDSAKLFETPLVFQYLNFSFDPTRSEVESLGKYMLGGGLYYLEGSNWHEWQGERYLLEFAKSALESQGYREGVGWEYQFLPNSHPIFHCYYDFPNGAPLGGAVVIKRLWGTGRDDGVEPWCRGIEIGGRWVALNPNQGYIGAWSEWGNAAGVYGKSAYYPYDPTLQFQFGINTVIFALTQEGSITRRVMDSVK